jgi:hypothetical protein
MTRAELQGLAPEQADAVPLLAAFEQGHSGVTIVRPSRYDEPWRVVIEPGSVPGDGREMLGHGDGPAELLAQLEALFSGE